MNPLEIEKSVGLGGKNKPIDVALIQRVLKTYFTKTSPPVKGSSSRVTTPSIEIDGEYSPALIDFIKQFQSEAVDLKHPDGRIDPQGKTMDKMASLLPHTGAGRKTILFGLRPDNTGILSKVDPERFKGLFGRQLGLTVTRGEDLLGFFEFLQKDTAIEDIRWAAYMLATAYIETGQSFRPVEEENGARKDYGKEKEVIDTMGCRGPVNEKYKNAYYGRGYCQLTHKGNYQAIGKALGLGDELVINPAKALEKNLAYAIISHGMRHGTFTKRKLADYINSNTCDYKNARQIINGLDRYKEFAEAAEQIELLLRLSAGTAATLPHGMGLTR